MDELSALSTLIDSADGRATPEPVIALGLAVGSPWAGDRLNLKDEPNKSAPSSPDAVIRFVGKVRSQLSAPLPADRGWLGWLRHSGLAMPLEDIQRCPAWVRDPSLADGWLALPPLDGFNGIEGGTIKRDGRLAALHVLASQVGKDVPRDAVEVLTEWFIGERAASWSTVSGTQCAVMVFPPARQGAWYRTFRSLSASEVVKVICGVPVAAAWTRPPLSDVERQALRELDLRRLAIRANFEATHRPGASPPGDLQAS